jgi:hypothetical protein
MDVADQTLLSDMTDAGSAAAWPTSALPTSALPISPLSSADKATAESIPSHTNTQFPHNLDTNAVLVGGNDNFPGTVRRWY